MKKLIDLSDSVIKILEKEAKENSRSLKGQIQHILIEESENIETANRFIETENKRLK